MKSLAVMVSGGSSNNFIQVLTLLLASVHSEITTRVLFRDASLFRVTKDGVKQWSWSPEYQGQEAALLERLKKHDLADLQKLLNQIKASGDVKLYACSSSLALAGFDAKALLPELDGVKGLTSFLLEEMATADQVVSC